MIVDVIYPQSLRPNCTNQRKASAFSYAFMNCLVLFIVQSDLLSYVRILTKQKLFEAIWKTILDNFITNFCSHSIICIFEKENAVYQHSIHSFQIENNFVLPFSGVKFL